MPVSLYKYPQVVKSLLKSKANSIGLTINEIDDYNYNGYVNFFYGDNIILKCERYWEQENKKEKVFIDPDRPSKICVLSPKPKKEKLIKSNIGYIPPLRTRVYERDGYKCLKCGENNLSSLTLDHVIPKSKGGKNNEENLQTLCANCNLAKGTQIIDYRNNL